MAIADRKAAFLEQLAVDANVSRSAKEVGVDRVQLYRGRDADEAFAKAWELHRRMGIGALEDECTRRAFEGVPTPITVAGKEVIVQKYSDLLLIFRLKAELPEKYRDCQPQVNVAMNIVDQSRPYLSLLERIRAKTAAKEAAEPTNGTFIENGKHGG